MDSNGCAINPGNSGGPLLNSRGEVIGISTQKVTKNNVTGISFALSASDLLSVLQKYYDGKLVPLASAPKKEDLITPACPESPKEETEVGVGTIVVDKPIGETVSIDGVVVGHVPAVIPVTAKGHLVTVTCHGHLPRTECIHVKKGSQVNALPVPWCDRPSLPALEP